MENHFRDVSKMVTIGGGAERATNDVELTRYACYIIAQNGNASKKPKVAAAQAYFALQTRKQELIQQRDKDMERLITRQKFTESDKRISETVLEKGMSSRGLSIIKDSGNKKMYGGKTTTEMKKVYGITNTRTPLANRTPNVVLAAKSLANEMTAVNLEKFPIDTFNDIREENDGNNLKVRNALSESGIVPDKMPPAEDTEKILKRFKAEDKKKAIEE
ncbi:MAG: DNA damage-inducible protein D [Candidatus Saccharimonadales bacterium]